MTDKDFLQVNWEWQFNFGHIFESENSIIDIIIMSRVNLSVPATRDKTPAPKSPAAASTPNKKSGTLKKNKVMILIHILDVNTQY